MSSSIGASTASTSCHSPLLFILFGPPGSGKSTGFKRWMVHLWPTSIKVAAHLNVDDFVYIYPQYREEYKRLNEEQRQDKNLLRPLFQKYQEQAHLKFEQQIIRHLNAKETIAVDTGVRFVEWMKAIVQPAQQNGYEVVLIYPFVPNIRDLMNRLFLRFEEKNQTPASKNQVLTSLENVPNKLKELIQIFQKLMSHLIIIDNASDSAFNGRIILHYDVKKQTCRFLDNQLEFYAGLSKL